MTLLDYSPFYFCCSYYTFISFYFIILSLLGFFFFKLHISLFFFAFGYNHFGLFGFFLCCCCCYYLPLFKFKCYENTIYVNLLLTLVMVNVFSLFTLCFHLFPFFCSFVYICLYSNLL